MNPHQLCFCFIINPSLGPSHTSRVTTTPAATQPSHHHCLLASGPANPVCWILPLTLLLSAATARAACRSESVTPSHLRTEVESSQCPVCSNCIPFSLPSPSYLHFTSSLFLGCPRAYPGTPGPPNWLPYILKFLSRQ